MPRYRDSTRELSYEQEQEVLCVLILGRTTSEVLSTDEKTLILTPKKSAWLSVSKIYERLVSIPSRKRKHRELFLRKRDVRDSLKRLADANVIKKRTKDGKPEWRIAPTEAALREAFSRFYGENTKLLACFFESQYGLRYSGLVEKALKKGFTFWELGDDIIQDSILLFEQSRLITYPKQERAELRKELAAKPPMTVFCQRLVRHLLTEAPSMVFALINEEIDFRQFKEDANMDFITAFVLLLNSYKAVDRAEQRVRSRELFLDFGPYCVQYEVYRNPQLPFKNKKEAKTKRRKARGSVTVSNPTS